MPYMDRIARCNQRDLTGARPFIVAGSPVGWVKPTVADFIAKFPGVFEITDKAVVLNPALADAKTRTEAVEPVARALLEEGFLNRWVGEPFKVATSWAAETLMTIERSAAPVFGIVSYGIHLNGYIRDEKGEIQMWIGRRAADRIVAPSQLDQLMAGGQPANLTLEENVIKECAEEAALPRELAIMAKPVGAISYCFDHNHGMRRDVLFNYDLELPRDFIPHSADGEMEEFYLRSLDRVAEVVRDTDRFKFNCSIVIIDFLIRHSYITPDHPEYQEILLSLHQDV